MDVPWWTMNTCKVYITNLACDENCSFIGSYILCTNIIRWKYIWHMNKCVDRWSTNVWMNECHTNFTSSNKFVFQMSFQCTILVYEMDELWMNKFCTISITKSWDAKFVMYFKCWRSNLFWKSIGQILQVGVW